MCFIYIIFVLKADDTIGDWRKLLNEELHNLYSTPNIKQNDRVKGDEIGKACSKHEGEEECIQRFGTKFRRKM
jgi:hypothetical protein